MHLNGGPGLQVARSRTSVLCETRVSVQLILAETPSVMKSTIVSVLSDAMLRLHKDFKQKKRNVFKEKTRNDFREVSKLPTVTLIMC